MILLAEYFIILWSISDIVLCETGTIILCLYSYFTKCNENLRIAVFFLPLIHLVSEFETNPVVALAVTTFLYYAKLTGR